ncbi:TPA: zinc-ribbon domain-containing protein, partial [Candidatus Poribacteria bacterium]|nr:zinc-ribbon domain-containing protein [Candidatus Poribacteria bacterium]
MAVTGFFHNRRIEGDFIMECPKCHHKNPTEAKFCMECGAKLENVCLKCGTKLPEEAKFCMECGTKVGELAKEAPKAAPPSVAIPKLEDMQKQLQSRIPQSLADRLFAGAKQMQGEYRLVTAVFADVSGSSGMAREMPLEQYVDTMNDCFKMMVDTISINYEGSINRFIGDCVLAFFGAPITHENDAERAILAALDIRDGLKELNLDVSIGINTGMTYVGEMGSDLYFE